MSQAYIKLQRKGQMVIPRSLRDEVGVPEGTVLKITVVEGGQFLVTPQVTIDRAVLSTRPKERNRALRELAEVMGEIRQEAKGKGLGRMPKREMEAAVAAARRDLKTQSKRRVK